MIKTNNHIHSKFSWDSKMSLDDIIQKLKEGNIQYGTITDHVEFIHETLPYVMTMLKIRNLELGRINALSKGKVILLSGIEISEPHLYKDQVYELECTNLDCILGSIHHFNKKAQTTSDKKLAYKQYYQDILEMIEKKQIDTIAHLDYINRYYDYDYSNPSQVKEILEAMIEKDIALEINTSANRRTKNNEAYYDIFPTIDKLEMYFDLGGEKLVIGSDAHRPCEVLDNLDIVDKYPILKEKKIGIYKNRKFETI